MTSNIDEPPYETDLESIRDVVGEMYMSINAEAWQAELPFDAGVEATIWDVAVAVLARHMGEYIIADPHRQVLPRSYPPHIIARKYDLSSLPSKGQTPHQLTLEIVKEMKKKLEEKALIFDSHYENLIIDTTETVLSRHIGLQLIDDSELPCSHFIE